MKDLSRRLTRKVRSVAGTRKVTVATPIILEVLGIVVPGKIVVVVRNLN